MGEEDEEKSPLRAQPGDGRDEGQTYGGIRKVVVVHDSRAPVRTPESGRERT